MVDVKDNLVGSENAVDFDPLNEIFGDILVVEEMLDTGTESPRLN